MKKKKLKLASLLVASGALLFSATCFSETGQQAATDLARKICSGEVNISELDENQLKVLQKEVSEALENAKGSATSAK